MRPERGTVHVAHYDLCTPDTEFSASLYKLEPKAFLCILFYTADSALEHMTTLKDTLDMLNYLLGHGIAVAQSHDPECPCA